MAITTRRPQKKRVKRRSPAWIPDQHGAWAMVTVPALTGLALAPSWRALPVLITWWVGYFAFFAISVWLRSKRLPRHRSPVIVYSIITAICGLITLAIDVTLLRWAPLFAPLVAIAVWETYQRRPRSLASGVSTVIAACLMIPVISSVALAPHNWLGFDVGTKIWIIAAFFGGYFVGTVPYVKTLIRERGKRSWLIGSIVYHAIFFLSVVAAYLLLADARLLSLWAVTVALIIFVRSIVMPISGQHRAHPWTPKTVGITDMFITVAVVLATW